MENTDDGVERVNDTKKEILLSQTSEVRFIDEDGLSTGKQSNVEHLSFMLLVTWCIIGFLVLAIVFLTIAVVYILKEFNRGKSYVLPRDFKTIKEYEEEALCDS